MAATSRSPSPHSCWVASASRLAPAFVLLLLASPGALRAQEERDTLPGDSVVYRLEGLVVEAARPVIRGGGASAVEVRLDSLEHVPSPTLAESLRRVPLIRVRQNSRGEVQPSLRGMEEREIAVLVDGVPITIGWDNRTDLSVVPLTGATELTVIRGLSSVLAGPNALGGVLEVGLTTDRLRRVAPPPARFGASLDHTGAVSLSGEGNHVRRGEEPDRGLWMRIGGGYRTSRGVALAADLPAEAEEDDRLLNSDWDYANGFLAGRWQSGTERSWAAFSSVGFWTKRGVVPELHLLGGDDPAPRYWRIPNQWRSLSSVSAGTGWLRTPFGEGDVEVSAGVDIQHMEIDAYDSPAYADSIDGETGKDRTLSLRVVADHTLAAGILRGAFTFAETRHEQILEGAAPEVFRQRLWSLGLETEQPLLSGRGMDGALSRPRISAGVSADGSSTPTTGSWPAQPTIWGWGARASGELAFWSGAGTFHAGLSRKVRFPALRELFSGALGKFVPNPDLEPITLKVLEAGATVSPLRGLAIQGILFTQRLEGAVVRVLLEDGRFQRQNRGETRANGVELLANWSSDGFAVRGDLTLQDVTLRDDEGQVTDEEPEYQPEVVGNVFLDVPLPWGLLGRAGVEYLGRQYGTNARTGTFDPLEGTAYVELGLSRAFEGSGSRPPVRASLVVENVTDEVIYDQLGLPRAGRTVRIGLDVF